MSEAARHFAVWRAAQAADWNITPAEIAKVTGIPVEGVAAILTERGWRLDVKAAFVPTDV